MNEFVNIKIVLVSLLPSPKTDNYSKNVFKKANKQLMDLANRWEFASFLNISRHFTNCGKLQMSKFKADKIHLNSNGALGLAKAIYGNVLSLKSKFSTKGITVTLL